MKRFREYIEEQVIKLRGFGGGGSAKNFMDDYHKETHANPISHTHRLHDDNAMTHLSQRGDNEIHIHDIVSLKKGGGTKAIAHLKSLADKHNVSISGTAKAYAKSSQHPMNTRQLGDFYQKRGFKVGQGNEHDGHSIKYTPQRPH